MNWDAVGAVREVGGAIAVVAMLVYPARQIRQSAEANIAGTQFAIPAEFNRVHEMDDCQPQRCWRSWRRSGRFPPFGPLGATVAKLYRVVQVRQSTQSTNASYFAIVRSMNELNAVVDP
jgi:hypothetical protein